MCPVSCVVQVPVMLSHTRKVWSELPLTMRPSANCATHTTMPVCPVSCIVQVPVKLSHTRKELSRLPLTMRPSASCTMHTTLSVCPVSCIVQVPATMSHSRKDLSALPLTMRPSASSTIQFTVFVCPMSFIVRHGVAHKWPSTRRHNCEGEARVRPIVAHRAAASSSTILSIRRLAPEARQRAMGASGELSISGSLAS